MKEGKEGSPKEEATESKQEAAQEGDEGVMLTPEFQKDVHKVVHSAKKHHLSHIRDRVNAREDELRKEEDSKKTKSKGPEEFSKAEMPESY